MAVGVATILGSFAARLGLDTNEYAKGVLGAQAMNAAFGQSFANFVTNPLLGSIDLFKKVAGGAIGLGKEVLADAEAVYRLGQQTGATTELLQALATRMEVAGFSGEQAAKGLLVLGKNMAEARANGGPLKVLFDQLGVSLDPGQPLNEGLAQLLDGLYALSDPAERSAIAMKLLGEEAGPRLVNAIGGGRRELQQMIEEGRRFGAVWGDEAVKALADANTALGYTDTAIANIQRRMAVAFLRGALGEIDTGTDGVLNLSEALNSELIPALEDAGRLTANLIKLLSDAGSGAKDFFDFLASPELIALAARGFVQQNPTAGAAMRDFMVFMDPNNRSGWAEAPWSTQVLEQGNAGR
jgi:hypothetical protein